MAHIPVLLEEAIDFLNPERGKAFIDATAGDGGHSAEILKRMDADALLVALDRDIEAITALKNKFSGDSRFQAVCGNFRDLQSLAGKFTNAFDGILFDLGMSTNQLEKSGRGFSFRRDEPLLMTYEAKPKEDRLTAALIVNTWPEDKLADIFLKYGEERKARLVARAIVKERAHRKIISSKDLAEIIASVSQGKRGKLHPATKVFQALRITVNDELTVLSEGLQEAWDILGESGRIVVISFHSLEDRIVKNFFKHKKSVGLAEILTKKPQTPSDEELRRNPASRSAKLRALYKLKNA